MKMILGLFTALVLVSTANAGTTVEGESSELVGIGVGFTNKMTSGTSWVVIGQDIYHCKYSMFINFGAPVCARASIGESGDPKHYEAQKKKAILDETHSMKKYGTKKSH